MNIYSTYICNCALNSCLTEVNNRISGGEGENEGTQIRKLSIEGNVWIFSGKTQSSAYKLQNFQQSTCQTSSTSINQSLGWLVGQTVSQKII